MGVTIKTIEVPPGGGTVKIQIPETEAGAEQPKSGAPNGKPGLLADGGRKIFVGCILIGILLLFGASILKNSGGQNKVAAGPKVEVVTPIKSEHEKSVDIKVNKADKVVAVNVNKPGEYYFNGNDRIIYCYLTVQR